MSSQLHGMLWMSAAGFLAVSINVAARTLSADSAFHAFQLVFFYNVLALPYMLRWVYVHYKDILQIQRLPLYTTRAVFEFLGFSLTFAGLLYMPLPVHTALNFLVPLFGSIAAVFFLREKSSIFTWVALAGGMVGVLLIVRPGLTDFGFSSLLLVGAAVCFSITGICIKKLTKTEPVGRITCLMFLLTTLISAPFAFAMWVAPSPKEWLCFLVIGFMAYLMQWFVSKAFMLADVSTILPSIFLNLVWSSCFAYLLFDEMVDVWTIIGGVTILGSFSLLTLYHHCSARVSCS